MESQPARGRRRNRILGALLFAAGALIGTAFFAAAVWADMEASLFNSAIRGDTALRSMTCPVVLAKGETGTVAASFHNPGPNVTSPTVRAVTSFHSITYLDQVDRRFTMEPGERVTLEWEIAGDDLVWGLFVFVRLYQFASYPLRSASGCCGILVLDIPLLGGTGFVVLTIGVSLLAMAGGLWIRLRAVRRAGGRALMVARSMMFLAVLVGVGMLAAVLGRWVLGLGVLVTVVLLAAAIGGMVLTGE